MSVGQVITSKPTDEAIFVAAKTEAAPIRMDPRGKYSHYLDQFAVDLPDRTWPSKRITAEPIWCSVDLRDGNQALEWPMNPKQKLALFEKLVEMGFREIEIGFPAASESDFDFTRQLIEQKLMPAHVTPQVLTTAVPRIVAETFRALEGVHRAIVHLYTPTSRQHREMTFAHDVDANVALALAGVREVKKHAAQSSSEIIFQYSPESFTGTELQQALRVCNAVIEEWGPTPDKKMILNLPATVEMSTPNIYADQIEWMCRNILRRDSVIISVHTHNDRAGAVTATEFGLMAGADRVEGALLGHGERTGNVDLAIVALNMFRSGIPLTIDFSNIPTIKSVVEEVTGMPVDARHPYSGDLVFTAFSGTHQDAIKKAMAEQSAKAKWDVTYLPMDPADIGRGYREVVRVNSQSGKSGIAHVIESQFQMEVPKAMQIDFAKHIQKLSERAGGTVAPEVIWDTFCKEYIDRTQPWALTEFVAVPAGDGTSDSLCTMRIIENEAERAISSRGNGPLDAARHALLQAGFPTFNIEHYSEHARGTGSDASAASYVQIKDEQGRSFFGAGIDTNSEKSPIKALMSALNNLEAQRQRDLGAAPLQSGLGTMQ